MVRQDARVAVLWNLHRVEIKQHLISALVSAAVSVSVCLSFSVARSNLPVRWQYDQAREDKRRRDAEEKERQRAWAEFARTNKPDSIWLTNQLFVNGLTMTNVAWKTFSGYYMPSFNETDIELGFRLDGVVLFRTAPETPRPKATNNLPLL